MNSSGNDTGTGLSGLEGDPAEWNSVEAYNLIAIDVFLVLYTLVGVFGNTAVIYIYSFKLKVKFDDKFFILVLAGMDIIVCSTGPLFSLARNVFPVNFKGDVFCRICWYFVRTMGTASGMLLFVIAVQRYLKVCRPFGRQMTPFINKVALGVTFGVAIIIDIPIFVFYGETKIDNTLLNVTGYRCGRKDGESPSLDQSILIYFFFMFACAGSVMFGVTVLYSMTGFTIYRQVKKHINLTSDTYKSSTRTNEQQSISKKDGSQCVSIQDVTLTDSPEVKAKNGKYKSIRDNKSMDSSPATKQKYMKKTNVESYVKEVGIENEESSVSKTTGSEESSKTNGTSSASSDKGYVTDDVLECGDSPPDLEGQSSSPGTCNGITDQVDPQKHSQASLKTVSFKKPSIETPNDEDVNSVNGRTKPKINSSIKEALPSNKSPSGITKDFRHESHVGMRWKKNRLMVHRFSIMFMMIAVVCTITYTPALIVNMLVNMDSTEYWTEFPHWQRALYMFLFQMYLLNHVVNPFIYAFFDKTFRAEFKAMLMCKQQKKRDQRKVPL